MKNLCRAGLATGVAFVILLQFHSPVNAQVDTSYAFIVAGHAYGSHTGTNIGLHPALLNSLSSGYDPNTAFIVFTGDIVNQSTAESWQQVENELTTLSLLSYYVMGNHDYNDAGLQVFEDKFGGAYYSFHWQNELFIVLNSIESDRSISTRQIGFLEEQLDQAGDTIQNIFIFFHEIIWNSHEKYIGVMSNSRSRYDQVVNYSNYWEEVHPILLGKPDKNFFLIAGDVGGNPDAIAAFYDRWDHITFLASGMGEVPDENYLLAHVYGKDSVEFELVPLNSELNLPGIEYYSVPPATGAITGPEVVSQAGAPFEYSVPEVFNASSYSWELPEGATGTSTSSSIELFFDIDFVEGNLSVQAAREGFGKGPPSSMLIKTDSTHVGWPEKADGSPQIDFMEAGEYLTFGFKWFDGEVVAVRIFNDSGRLLKSQRLEVSGGYAEMQMNKNDLSGGIIFLSASSLNRHITGKFLIGH